MVCHGDHPAKSMHNIPSRIARKSVVVEFSKEEALQSKDEGNDFFRKSKYKEAAAMYQAALSVLRPRAISGDKESAEQAGMCEANRAICYLKRRQPQAAVACATRALAFTPNNVKALYRRALGCTKCG